MREGSWGLEFPLSMSIYWLSSAALQSLCQALQIQRWKWHICAHRKAPSLTRKEKLIKRKILTLLGNTLLGKRRKSHWSTAGSAWGPCEDFTKKRVNKNLQEIRHLTIHSAAGAVLGALGAFSPWFLQEPREALIIFPNPRMGKLQLRVSITCKLPKVI